VPDYDEQLSRIVDELNRKADDPPPDGVEMAAAADSGSLDELLRVATRRRATDILLIAGTAVTLRVDGALVPSGGPALSGEEVRNLALPLLTQSQYTELQKTRHLDFRILRPELGRFRANLHYQRGTLAACIRLLPTKIPDFQQLNLPAGIADLAEKKHGLILVTGPAGCGKSSTLAALIDAVNRTRRAHIITIEDPIEYEHTNHLSIIEQIEVGIDTPDFPNTLRSILRQTPDVILVGEMRDPETISTALTAAETGHLVLSTLHSNDTSQAISRILDSFPEANQPQIRQQLSLAMLAIIAQQLVPAVDGNGRCPALEILRGTDAVGNLIRHAQDHQIRSQLTIGRTKGMMTMEQSLAELVRHGTITREVAMAHCFRSDDMRDILGVY
jgi:twitching motility protein PilT